MNGHSENYDDLETQQSVVSTIKSEDLEFVSVDQEVWDSFESPDFSINQDDSEAATSTTQKSQANTSMTPPSTISDSIEEINHTKLTTKRYSMLFRGGFFRLVKDDGNTTIAQCLHCVDNKAYRSPRGSTSNFLQHLSRQHPKQYKRLKAMKEEASSIPDQVDKPETKFRQKDLNRIVLDFMISAMLPPNLLDNPAFDTLLNDVALMRKIGQPSRKQFKCVSQHELQSEIDDQFLTQANKLSNSLQYVSGISTAVDVWSTRQKTFMSVVINWIDSMNFQCISNMMSCEVFDNPITTELLNERLHQIYIENDIANKVVATMTNNCLRFDEAQGCTYVHLEGLEHQTQNPTHLFELIGSVDALQAMNDEQYAEIHNSAFYKVDALLDCFKNSSSSENIAPILNKIFNHQQTGSKVVESYNNISSLVHFDSLLSNTMICLLEELKIPHFTEVDMKFLREYVDVLKPIATAIEHLQTVDCYYATFLPMVYSVRGNLMGLQNQGKIHSCQALLKAILDGIEQRFSHLFDFNNEKCIPAIIATCTHPYFKMRWVKGDLKTPTNTARILDLLVQAAKEFYDGKQNKATDEPSNDDMEQPAKKFKSNFSFDFESSPEDEESDETIIEMDLLSYLKKPCQNNENNLEELNQYPLIKKLFIKYNSIIVSSAALERSIPLTDLIRKSQSGEINDEIFCKLCCLRSKPILTHD